MSKTAASRQGNETANNPLVSASNFNINVTNLTNSLIVTQNNNQSHGKESANPLEIPNKIKVAHHKKSKSQGQKNGLNNQTNGTNVSNPFAKKATVTTGYKTSLEFYDGQLRKKK